MNATKTFAIAALLAAATLAGCAGPAPREQLGAAQNAVRQAERSEAPLHAEAELRAAQAKLAEAEAAFRNDEHARARRLADEAVVDAELAQARAEAIIAQRSAAQMQRSVEALRRETADRRVSP